MKSVPVSLSIVILLMASAVLSSCGASSAPPAPHPTYSVGVTVVNLAGSGGGLVLQNNATQSLPVNTNGSFTFSPSVARGTPYNITISTQPVNPAQTCGVTNASGTVNAKVNVQVNCGHGEWAFMNGFTSLNASGAYGSLGVAASTNNPGARQLGASWTDASGNLWLFGGYGYDSAGVLLPMSDLWKYSGGQWTWVAGPDFGGQWGIYGSEGVPTSANIPGARFMASSWTDASGNFWLFGGMGFDTAGNEASLNDLWKYSNGAWTWMSGSNLADQPGSYGNNGVPASDNVPPARSEVVSWVDLSGNFWLFGGIGSRGGQFNDLWKYSNGQWTWISGSFVVDQNGVYGTQGVPAASNVPGGRFSANGWVDSSGNLWLFGGEGYPAFGSSGSLNDLWKYSNQQWTWMSGSPLPNQVGSYGTQGFPVPSNVPGSRQSALSWTDSSGNFWLFGGNGLQNIGFAGQLNDLWKYSNGEWTWMSGSPLVNQNGVYGTQGKLDPGNVPGGRVSSTGWVDANGNLWLPGGWGSVEGAGVLPGDLGDLWMYLP